MINRLMTLQQLLSLLGWRQVLRLVAARMRGASSFEVTVPGVSHPLCVRFNNSDLVLLIGIFHLKDCHLQLTPDPATIIDLGANTGLTAVALRGQFSSAQITALEPDASTYAVCVRNTGPYVSIHCQQRMIAGASGWCRPKNPGVISMARSYEAVPGGSAGKVAAITLPELLSELNAPGPILIKMDIEGSEIQLFEHADGWLPSVAGVLVEPHGAGTEELIRRVFTAHGFGIGQIGEKLWGYRIPAWRQPVQPSAKPA